MNKTKEMKYEAVIGLEIHAELKTNSKMFCSCKNDPFHSKQNTNICPVCMAMPGALPVLNRQAIEWTIKTGLALNCKVNEFSKWDRKNYFYPDLPKGYQISQYDLPLVYQGFLEIPRNKKQVTNKSQNSNSNNQTNKIRITRIHLEEDTATSKHPEGRAEVDYSLVDFNRAGAPLMELVTEPDIRTAAEAKEFCQQYQLILRTLGVADADMEKGQMRCEANISIRKSRNDAELTRTNAEKSAPLGTKVEVKNLNSFKAVEKAIEYEIKRQAQALDDGEKIVQETRGWDDRKQKTYVMRVKETSADYRYFPEPDLPPIQIGARSKDPLENTLGRQGLSIDIEKIKKELPELPSMKQERYVKDYKLSQQDAGILAGDIKKAEYFESSIKYKVLSIKYLANLIINELPDLDIKPEYLAELVNLIEDGKISGKIAKEILPQMKKGKKPSDIIKEKGLSQISDTGELEKIIDKVVKDNPDAVAKIKAGQMGVMGFLVGQIMSSTRGQANPKVVNDILRKKLQ